jgi:hypothetical protein
MDDINLVRTALLDDGEPGAAGRAAGRLTLQRAAATERAGGAARTRRWRLALAGTGLVAAAAAAAVLAGLGGPAGPVPPGGPGTIAAPRTAQDFLLAAATRAAQAPATSGKYWHTRWDMRYPSGASIPVSGGSPQPQPPEIQQVTEQWQAADPGDQSWSSFTRIRHGVYRPEAKKVDGVGYGWEAEFSPAEVRALPTDPAALRAVIAAKQAGKNQDLPSLSSYLFDATIGLLARALATPAQMAAGYRLLADLPDVQLGGTATDSVGRTGVVLRHQTRNGADEVIIDRTTYQVLARTTTFLPGLTGHVVYTAREWTNTEPPH